jgi:hypothetical protein
VKVITCPHCGKVAATLSLGRSASNIGVTEVYDALRLCHSVPSAAEKLGCSRALIYKILRTNGTTPADVIKGHATKDNSLLHKGAVSGER